MLRVIYLSPVPYRREKKGGVEVTNDHLDLERDADRAREMGENCGALTKAL